MSKESPDPTMAECLEEAISLASDKNPLTIEAVALIAVALYQERMQVRRDQVDKRPALVSSLGVISTGVTRPPLTIREEERSF